MKTTIVLMLLGASSLVTAAIPEPIKLDAGLITGLAGKLPEVRVFKGIPYAAPPVGELRWRAPQPVALWQGVRKADEFSAICMQAAAPGSTANMSEDCLYLNVFTAAQRAGEKRPVMVWLHPGGYNSGSGSQPAYDGERFASKGVVIVTINYRLGALGFFSHPQLTQEGGGRWAANQAFLDQTAALQWVQRNIAAFGGDPRKVTVFGNSAGGTSISNLVASPTTRGLFVRAISQSGAWLGLSIAPVRTLADAEAVGVKAAETLQAQSLADLRAKPAADILRGARGAGPVIDGVFYPTDPAQIYAQGKQNKVAILAGSNKDEGTFFLQPTTAAAWTERVQQRFGDRTADYLKLYPATSDEVATQSQYDAFRDELGWRLNMLTALPHDDSHPEAAADKYEWIEERWPDIPVRLGPYSHDKWRHARPGDILVDDRPSNIQEWREAGGIAVQVTADYDRALAELEQLFKDTSSLQNQR
jgi:para-nitrobenzyl esterase